MLCSGCEITAVVTFYSRSYTEYTNQRNKNKNPIHNILGIRYFHFSLKVADTLKPFLSLSTGLCPAVGAADAEIKIPSVENTELKGSPFKAWT